MLTQNGSLVGTWRAVIPLYPERGREPALTFALFLGLPPTFYLPLVLRNPLL